ncbi:cobalt-precorrin-6A reductase [Cumulibacter manganitolerans]|uniref:cobalt-precorrin-6A reductase n=1 Tax=Cumulibacter manganitolerans TaxID=1884992 RepID=UPI001296182D|nr:cobalt-precorrin-6A reductase [Cumulibacter manganitolerans]
MRVLILGGTAEARALAALLADAGRYVVSSLAGRVARPRLPVGEVRIGGFGGPGGLAEFLRSASITHLVDATHPFATTMTRHAVEAAAATGVPLVRFARPGWRSHPHADRWHWAASYDDARAIAEGLGRRPFLTTGRQTLPYFRDAWADRTVVVRVVEPLETPPPAAWQVLLARGPYAVDAEVALMREHRVDVLLTKDSGGGYTAAKLEAAARLDVPVVVVARPALPSGAHEVASLDGVSAWLDTERT